MIYHMDSYGNLICFLIGGFKVFKVFSQRHICAYDVFFSNGVLEWFLCGYDWGSRYRELSLGPASGLKAKHDSLSRSKIKWPRADHQQFAKEVLSLRNPSF